MIIYSGHGVYFFLHGKLLDHVIMADPDEGWYKHHRENDRTYVPNDEDGNPSIHVEIRNNDTHATYLGNRMWKHHGPISTCNINVVNNQCRQETSP